MDEAASPSLESRALDFLDRHWKWIVAAAWLVFVAWMIVSRWTSIRWFALGDTDDNMRIMQVRAWLHGQNWYDLRQYRLNPPYGANIHWSRLVDLPLAGLILGLRPLFGGANAEKWAVAIAPLLPLLLLFFSLALTVRRLISPSAYPLAFAAMFFAGSANGMFAPERIDHHGWQLAFLALCVAAIADPDRRRSGLVLGFGTAVSLAIGLEMLIYLALAGVWVVLAWVIDERGRERMQAYGVSVAAGTAIAFLVFASNANWFAVCDALSPVWLSDALLGGALLFALAWRPQQDWRKRLAFAAAAGVVIAAFHALAWPHCLSRLEGVSPEVERLWLSHVREARPIWRHGWRTASMIATLPVTGIIGYALLAWWKRADRELLLRVVGASLPLIAATMLLLWQTRTGPAAQMLGTVGATALAWLLIPLAWKSSNAMVRVVGTALIVIISAGALLPFVLQAVPEPAKDENGKAVSRANYLCNSMWGYTGVARQPKGIVFTFVDFGPRLITVTHHDSITGPYHRNGQQIADVMNFWRGSEPQAHALVQKYRANYVLSCPNSSSATIFQAEAPKGFYVQLQKGQVPSWLQPIDLGADSPFRMWKVAG